MGADSLTWIDRPERWPERSCRLGYLRDVSRALAGSQTHRQPIALIGC